MQRYKVVFLLISRESVECQVAGKSWYNVEIIKQKKKNKVIKHIIYYICALLYIGFAFRCDANTLKRRLIVTRYLLYLSSGLKRAG